MVHVYPVLGCLFVIVIHPFSWQLSIAAKPLNSFFCFSNWTSNQYILAGMSVAYAAPRRHPMICVVENNFCASRRGEFIYASLSGIFMRPRLFLVALRKYGANWGHLLIPAIRHSNLLGFWKHSFSCPLFCLFCLKL